MEVNLSLFCLLIFYSLPTINFLAYGDVKVDLGLLFILFAIVLLLINWMDKEAAYDSMAGLHQSNRFKSFIFPLLLGLLSGFAIGVKLTAIFAVFGVLSIFAFYYFQLKGVITVFFLTIFSIILLRLDQLNGMREAFIGINYIQWLLFLLGIGGLAYFLKNNRNKFIRVSKLGLVYLFFIGIAFSPWLVKNYAETGEISTASLLSGRSNNTQINYSKLYQKWVDEQNK